MRRAERTLAEITVVLAGDRLRWRAAPTSQPVDVAHLVRMLSASEWRSYVLEWVRAFGETTVSLEVGEPFSVAIRSA